MARQNRLSLRREDEQSEAIRRRPSLGQHREAVIGADTDRPARAPGTSRVAACALVQ